MLYPVIFNIISSYLYNINIIDENNFEIKCSQCRNIYHHSLLWETTTQSWKSRTRLYCPECRLHFGLFFQYKNKSIIF